MMSLDSTVGHYLNAPYAGVGMDHLALWSALLSLLEHTACLAWLCSLNCQSQSMRAP